MQYQNRNPKLVIKNAALLVMRFFLTMLLSFYTTRVTLQILGDIDYGINNIIGGLISMFAVVSMPLTNALQRYFNVELAKGELDIKLVFNTSFRICVYITLLLIVLFETLGLYLVNYVLEYPCQRVFAVNVSYQITSLITLITFFTIPFSALLYSKEKMGFPATVELVSNVLKLIFLLFLPFIKGDDLILYTCSLLVVSFIQIGGLAFYCIKRLNIRLGINYETSLFKDMLKFSGWNSVESLAGISLTYLSNILINVFGGVLFNTANGLARSVTNAVSSFTTNVIKAVEPQITSSTVLHDTHYRDKLLLTTIKVSAIFTALVAIYFSIDGDRFLSLWLGNVPQYTFIFCKILLISSVFSTVILPLRTMIIASGEIKSYFIVYGVISSFVLIVMFVVLKMGLNVMSVPILCAFATFCNLLSAMYHSFKKCSLSRRIFFSNILRILAVVSVVAIVANIAHVVLIDKSWVFISDFFICVCVVLLSTYFLGVSKDERSFIKQKFNSFIKL